MAEKKQTQKVSGNASQNYWKRVSPEAQRRKRIARHAKRLGLTQAQTFAATLSDPFNGAPRTRRPGGTPEYRRPLPMAALHELPRNFSGSFVIAAGVILEASPHSADLHRAFSESSIIPRKIVRRDELGNLTPTEVRTR